MALVCDDDGRIRRCIDTSSTSRTAAIATSKPPIRVSPTASKMRPPTRPTPKNKNRIVPIEVPRISSPPCLTSR